MKRDMVVPQISRVQRFRFTITRAINNAKYGFDGINRPWILSPFKPSRQTQIDDKVSKVIGGIHFLRANTFQVIFDFAKVEFKTIFRKSIK